MLHFNLLIDYGVENLISIYPDGSELIMDNGFGMIIGGRQSCARPSRTLVKLDFRHPTVMTTKMPVTLKVKDKSDAKGSGGFHSMTARSGGS